MDAVHIVIIVVALLVWLASWIAAVRSISSTRLHATVAVRGVWIAVVIVLPVLGPIIWFAAGRRSVSRS